jgi:hypothetical protein
MGLKKNKKNNKQSFLLFFIENLFCLSSHLKTSPLIKENIFFVKIKKERI